MYPIEISKFRDQYVKKKESLEICFILKKNGKKKEEAEKFSFFHLFIYVIYFIKIMFKEFFYI